VFAVRGEYMTATAPEDFVDLCDNSPELTRDFRGLRIWLPLKMYGVQTFEKCLDEKLDLAQYAMHRLRQIDGLEVCAEPQLSIVAFRLRAPHLSRERLDRLNHQWLDRINASKRVMLSGTTLECGFVLRMCILCFRTHRDRIEECLNLISREAQVVLADI
jgi:aromatic-L-amino-acid decarboxylase